MVSCVYEVRGRTLPIHIPLLKEARRSPISAADNQDAVLVGGYFNQVQSNECVIERE